MNLVTHSWSSVSLTNILNCSTEYLFWSISKWNYFPFFYEAFYTFGFVTPFVSDLTQKLVQGTCYKTAYSYFFSFYDHAAPFLFLLFFKIFVFAGFILMTLIHTTFIWCLWCNGYRRRNWTRRHEFKSWIDCISHSTNTLGKGMNPIILPPARFFSLGEGTSLGEGKLWIQTCETPLKKLTLCHILPEWRGWVNMIWCW